MTQYLLDLRDGTVRPSWTDNRAVGFLVEYLDAHDTETSTEDQMRNGYMQSAGTSPYEFDVGGFYLSPSPENDGASILASSRYPDDPPYLEVSRCTAANGDTVIMFEAAMTAIVRDGQLAWLARLD